VLKLCAGRAIPGRLSVRVARLQDTQHRLGLVVVRGVLAHGLVQVDLEPVALPLGRLALQSALQASDFALVAGPGLVQVGLGPVPLLLARVCLQPVLLSSNFGPVPLIVEASNLVVGPELVLVDLEPVPLLLTRLVLQSVLAASDFELVVGPGLVQVDLGPVPLTLARLFLPPVLLALDCGPMPLIVKAAACRVSGQPRLATSATALAAW
jgi:hypothetical protein